MKIKEITVINLFGLFNHVIEFKLDDRITIIHGPNGFGKTILLKFINSFFNRSYSIFYEIPFDEFSIEFTNNTVLKIYKDTENKLMVEVKNSITDKMEIPKINFENIAFPRDLIEEICPYVNHITRDQWFDIQEQVEINTEKVLDKYGHYIFSNLPSSLKNEIRYDEAEWLTNIIDAINVRFIQTQRLLAFGTERRFRRSYTRDISFIAAVNLYSKEIIDKIQEVLADYATTSQSLDRTFPKRLMTMKIKTLNTQELKSELEKLEEDRIRLIDLGLLEKGEEDFQPEGIKKGSEDLLSVYINDIKSKLAIFDKLAKKIEILKEIINNHFLYKTVIIDKDQGFIFINKNKKQIYPHDLSSGEQHELVLLYELLFKIKDNTMILIDEPEISLHVAWQKQFLKDIQSISNIRNFDILIATHSPQIINDRWDLTVTLKGIEDE